MMRTTSPANCFWQDIHNLLGGKHIKPHIMADGSKIHNGIHRTFVGSFELL